MAIVTIHEAKTNLSSLIARAENGEEIVIARGREPVVRLLPMKKRPVRKFGALADVVPHIPDSFFFDPLPDEELDAWEGNAPSSR